MKKGQKVRVKDDAQFTTYAGRTGTIITAFVYPDGLERYGVRFKDGGASVYRPDELELAEQERGSDE